MLALLFLGGNLRYSNGRLHKDVAPYFLAEAIVVTIDKSEERDVVSWSLWCSHVNCDLNLLTGKHNLIQRLRSGLEIITVSLDEESVFGPLLFTSISEGPSLGEALACKDTVSVTKAFLDKPSLVNGFSFLRLFIGLS